MKARALTIGLLGCLAAAAMTAPAAGAATCEAATVVATAEADAWVDANSVTASKGSDAVLSVGGTSRALVRFRLPSGVPEGCVVESARLRMFADSGTDGTRVEAVPLASGWSEGSVTWTNQPASVGAAAAAWSRDGYMQWNVTAQLPAMLAGPNHGFGLRDAADGTELAGGHGFYAREKGQNPPQLVIRFAPPPTGEPAPPAPPEPAAVSCGQLVTRSTLVTNDLSNCPGDGLLVGAPRIVVDLGGHTIDGVKLGIGVRNEGYEDVTVRNGTVTEFDHGVALLEETKRGVVERLHVHHNEVAAIELFDTGGVSAGNEIRSNTVEDNGGGILLVSGTKGTVVADNALTLNSGAALLLRDADANRLERNRVVGGGDLGIGLEHSSGNTLVGNVVSDTSDGGIEIQMGSHDNRVEGSDVRRSGDTGILVSESQRTELIGNTTVGMSDSGITLNSANGGVVRGNQLGGNPGGLQMDGSSHNLVDRNDASDGSGIGIELGGGSYGNTLTLNTASSNGAQGIYVSDEALLEPGNLLHRNTADENGSDGITIAKGGHMLTANVALGNGGWGINAVGINIAARNAAAGNSQAAQCSGVPCGPLDVRPPATTIDSGPVAFTNQATATFSFSTDEEFTAFECSLDGAEFTACVSPREYADLTDGTHELRVRATDEFGNVDASPASYRWEIDHTPPETMIDSGPDAVTRSAAATFGLSADEPGSTFECSLDGANFTPCGSPAELTDLADGSHTFAVRATDAAGNTDETPAIHLWAIDQTPPETTIDTGPDAVTRSGAAAFDFSADEAGSTFECSLDGADFTPCGPPAAYLDLLEGSHTFAVRATDRVGNADGSPASYAWTIDRTPPQTSIDSGPDAITLSTGATLAFSADEPASFECRLDLGDWAACISPQGHVGLLDGEHTFSVRATDAAGNLGEAASHIWVVDTVAPETRIESGPADPTNRTSASFEFSADEDARFECRLDEGDWGECSAYVNLADGQHTFQVRAIDRAGSVGAAASYTWTIDTLAPEVKVDSGPADPTNVTAAEFTFSASEEASFECRLDEGDWGDCVTYTDLADGRHTFEVRATDPAGDVGDPASYSWTVDTIAPQVTIDSGPADPTNATSASFEFSASEDATFECRLDAGDWAGCEEPHGLTDGDHTFQVRATDGAGNRGAAASHAWTVDTVAPTVTIDHAPSNPSNDPSPAFEFSADEDASFECRLDAGDWAECENPRGLTDGDHAFEVRATDRAGNLGAAASHSWTVDTVAPAMTIDRAPANPSNDSSPVFEFSADEPASFECRLDTGDWDACENPTGLSDGEHTFAVRATDGAGNVSAPVSYTWLVDTVAPVVTIGSGPADPSGTRAATFEFSSDDAAGFECRLDDGEWASCESPQGYADLGDGSHTFEVRASDRAGNAGAAASHTWTIAVATDDVTAPETTITERPADPSNSASATFAFVGSDDTTPASALEFRCRLDGAAATDCTSPVTYSNLGDARHTFEVHAVDAAGNAGKTPATNAWTVDTVAPAATIDRAPHNPTTERTASFQFSADEAATFACRLDAGDWAACTSPQAYVDLAEAEHTFQVRATDAAGNLGARASYAWTIEPPPDLTAPDTLIGDAPPATTSDASARFTFESTEPGSSFECALDDQAFGSCSSPREYRNLTLGSHQFRVRATDAAGNTDESPATHRWTVEAPPDTTAPDTTITARPPALSSSASATFEFTADEPATFECRLDGGTPSECSSPAGYTGLTDGSHTFEVRATDAAGNRDASPATHTWTVDTTPPQTTIDSAPPATTTSTSATFTFSAGDTAASFECSLDGAAFTACASPRAYSALGQGVHRFSVRATDAARNTDPSPASHTWTVEAPAPTCPAPVTATANADAWIDENSPTNNKGSDSILKVQSKGPRDNFRALVRFALPTLPAGCTLESATLRLYAASAKTGRTLEAYRAADPWTESQVNWSNRPQPAGIAATASSGLGWREWSVTSQVQAMYAVANHGFLVRDAIEGTDAEQQLHSREKGENVPQLVLRFAEGASSTTPR